MTRSQSIHESGGRSRGLLSSLARIAASLSMLFIGIAWGMTLQAFADGAENAQTHVVEIRQFKFSPADLHVKAGDLIIWKNLDAVPHTATAKAWDSGRLKRNESWSFRASDKGTFEYICTYHPAMKGKIIVE